MINWHALTVRWHIQHVPILHTPIGMQQSLLMADCRVSRNISTHNLIHSPGMHATCILFSLYIFFLCNNQLEWHCIALLCFCAIKKLLTHCT